MNFVYLFQFILLATLTFSVPHKKNFNEHLEDFLGHVLAEVGDEFEHILANYSEKEEFVAAITYFSTAEFNQVFLELVSLQEFRAIVAFLEKANIKANYFIEEIKEILEYSRKLNSTKTQQHMHTKGDLRPFVTDCANLFEKVNLPQLYEDKKQDDEDFRHLTEKFETGEWRNLSSALLENETVKKVGRKLEEHGIDLQQFFAEVKALLRSSH